MRHIFHPMYTLSGFLVAMLASPTCAEESGSVRPERKLLWGDTHVHTYNSSDAFLLMNRSVSPDDAYRFAKGSPVAHPLTGRQIRLATPLDFMVVADHAESLGVVRLIFEGDERIADTPLGRAVLEAAAEGKELNVFSRVIAGYGTGDETVPPGLDPESLQAARVLERDAWIESAAAADRHNEPGKFTAFIGWEWTSMPGGSNLHRVVIMREDASLAARFAPYSSFQSARPEDLWGALDQISSAVGANFIAIPHNPNLSNGLMFAPFDSAGRPMDVSYARTRMKWEPLAEVTQVKGDSETHPRLSPNDEFAEFEYYSWIAPTQETRSQEAFPGSYLRAALLLGLQLADRLSVNPFKLGLIGSTDTHTGLSTAREDGFPGKYASDAVPGNPAAVTRSAQGLAAVWAEENTRESVFEAMRRREVYATTGPRIQVRFFGGWDFQAGDATVRDLADLGYSKGVPMGGDLAHAPDGKAPTFLLHAVKDPLGANLDRIQIVKGWVDGEGGAHERVFDVVLSDGREPSVAEAPAVGNTVDLDTGTYDNTIGDAQLTAVWTDPEFDAARRAFYYARVIQIPTPRHSLHDSIALEQPHPDGYPPTLQERAYTSPIWFTPAD